MPRLTSIHTGRETPPTRPATRRFNITTITANPAALYMANLSEGSQGMRQSLDAIARILDSEQDAESFPWQDVTYSESMAVRLTLTKRYKPATVNKMLSALRGVLKQTWD